MDAVKEKRVCDVFNIDNLYDDQRKSLTALTEKKDVFLSTKTSSGNATYIGRDEKENVDIEDGKFTFVFSSPENLLGDQKWRNVMLSNRPKLRLIVIDKAHTMLQWGESHGPEKPFRAWFGHIAEVRSLCPATAGPKNREKIYRKLCLVNPLEIVKNPDRPNIKLFLKKVKASDNLADVFFWLVDRLQRQGQNFPRYILFCKRISECAGVFNVFRSFSHTDTLFNMYHSCTRNHVKQAIASDMNKEDGKIRVFICTNAAGRGVNFKGITHVVNFGPPVELDTFIQQIGRAGSDDHILIYNGRQLKNIDSEVKKYTQNSDTCRRKVLCGNYTSDLNISIEGHKCCDICSASCNCGKTDCNTETFQHSALVHVDDDSDNSSDSSSNEFSEMNTMMKVTMMGFTIGIDTQLLYKHMHIYHALSCNTMALGLIVRSKLSPIISNKTVSGRFDRSPMHFRNSDECNGSP
ncbi:hypothetical protein KUTeg_020092 [Tegillarca granosa]|uniref:DNA 3'-5' helicase n=1 Tax=Tegillarca granosa TaxID=220873 RepID=A0ABQ9EC75_TEGGR|nr:hypothetical protein KUTeg_020092 [Tegillarca granosa]